MSFGLIHFITCALPICFSMMVRKPINERVSDILSKMTLTDKVSQLNSGHAANPKIIWGMVDYSDVTSSCKTNITCRIIARNNYQAMQMKVSPLNIPVSFRTEALHSSAPGGTIFPVPCLLGSTWNTTLLETIGEIIAYEASVMGVDLGFSPVLQVLTDPRFGRFTESYGGDPVLVTHLGFYMSRGVSGGGDLSQYITPGHINNQGKHFIAYAFGGKDGLPCDVSERTLREVYLRPWEAFVASGGRSVMVAHNSVNGMPMHANDELLTDVLRNEFNWTDGLIGSDCADISKLYARGAPWSHSTGFHIAADMNGAVLKSMNAGMDLSLCDNITKNVLYNINHGLMNMTTLDRAVSNILHSKISVGLFDTPMVQNYTHARVAIVNNATAKRVAKEAALEGIVLLKNKNNILPLDATKISSLAIIGPVANDQGAYYGPYANAGAEIITIIDALKASNQYNFNLSIVPGCDAKKLSIVEKDINEAVSAADKSDYVLLIVGDTLKTDGENKDRVGLELPGGQLYLMSQVLKVKPNRTVVVYMGSRPGTFGTGLWNRFASITSDGVRDNAMLVEINALLSAYHPGQQGGNALVEIIFGKVSPSGRLSTSWPQSAAHVHSLHSPFLKAYQGHENFDYVYNTVGPLFPFGYGLSYANITHSNHPVIKETKQYCQWNLQVEVNNHSPFPSAEVVQIYYTLWVSDVVRNELELAGFQKVLVPPNSSIKVNVVINADSLSYYSTREKKWILEDGLYYLYDGKNAKEYNAWSTSKLSIPQQISNPCKFWSNL